MPEASSVSSKEEASGTVPHLLESFPLAKECDVIVPDDIWKDVRKRHKRCLQKLSRFIEEHPEQHKCIAPTGKEMMELGRLLRALSRANRKEEKKGSG